MPVAPAPIHSARRAPLPVRLLLSRPVGVQKCAAASGRAGGMVRVAADTPVREGDLVRLRLPPHRVQLFDATGMRVAQQDED